MDDPVANKFLKDQSMMSLAVRFSRVGVTDRAGQPMGFAREGLGLSSIESDFKGFMLAGCKPTATAKGSSGQLRRCLLNLRSFRMYVKELRGISWKGCMLLFRFFDWLGWRWLFLACSLFLAFSRLRRCWLLLGCRLFHCQTQQLFWSYFVFWFQMM